MSTENTSRKSIKLALLMCDTPIPSVREQFGTYLDIFRTQLQLSNPNQSFPFTLDGFDVVDAQEYPDLDAGSAEDGYRGILISGSAHTAHEDVPWINKLVAWVAEVARTHPEIRLIGICFGHQIIARALGGVCERNPAGWEVGVTDIQLTDLGKEVFRTQETNIPIQQMHLDHVTSLPPGFELLGSTAKCPVHGMLLKYPEDAPRYAGLISQEDKNIAPSLPKTDLLSRTHIITVQGHPEFTTSIVSRIIDAREASGRMNEAVVAEGRANMARSHEGIGLVGRAIWRVLGVETEPDK